MRAIGVANRDDHPRRRFPAIRGKVVRIDVQSRSDLVGGQAFGAAGAYEKDRRQDLLRGSIRRCRPTASSPISTRRRANAAGKGGLLRRLLPDQAEADRGAATGSVLYEVSKPRRPRGCSAFTNHARGQRRSGHLRAEDGRRLPDGVRASRCCGWAGSFDVPQARRAAARCTRQSRRTNGRPIRRPGAQRLRRHREGKPITRSAGSAAPRTALRRRPIRTSVGQTS